MATHIIGRVVHDRREIAEPRNRVQFDLVMGAGCRRARGEVCDGVVTEAEFEHERIVTGAAARRIIATPARNAVVAAEAGENLGLVLILSCDGVIAAKEKLQDGSPFVLGNVADQRQDRHIHSGK